MKLCDYPGLFGKWPPPAHDPAGESVRLDHCLDTVVLTLYGPRTEPRLVRILTEYESLLSMRELIMENELLARVFCGFLNKQRGKTIREIGEMDATFLG